MKHVRNYMLHLFLIIFFMLRIGLTGGMGCGKTTVANVFKTLGVPVYFADDAAKRLMHTDEKLKAGLIRFFGNDIFINGRLNKSALSSRVFGDRTKLNKLNSLVHPATIKDSQAWMEKQNAYYAIKEAALIFESNSENNLDYIIGVSSPLHLRIKRIKARDNFSQDEIIERMSNQMDEDLKMEKCHFIIFNNEEKMLIPQIISMHNKLLSLNILKSGKLPSPI